MTSVSKNVYIDKYNNTYQSTIKIKLVAIKSSTHIESSKEINENDLNF